MADQRQSDVLGALPRHRPQRRSAKRPARANGDPAQTKNGATSKSTAGSSRPGARTTRAGSSRAPESTQPKATPRLATASRGSGQAGSVRPIPNQAPIARGTKGTARRGKADRLRQPPQPRGIPSQPRSPVPPSHSRSPAPSDAQRPELLGTFVQAAAELTEIGLSLGAQVLRRAVSRLPRP